MTTTFEEKVCAAIVADVLGARWERIPQHSHDFDIVFENRRRDYLEVSAYTNREIEARWANHPAPRPSSVLRGTWTLVLTDEADLATVQESAEPLLLALQQQGVPRWYLGEHFVLLARHGAAHPLVQASAGLCQLGVEDAAEGLGTGEPAIMVAQQVSTVGVPSTIIDSAVESVASRPDNIAKLKSTIAQMTHLFIVFHTAGGAAWSLIAHDPPSGPRTMSPSIGRVWTLGRQPDWVWYSDAGAGWKRASFNPGVFKDPDGWSV